jgi:transposase
MEGPAITVTWVRVEAFSVPSRATKVRLVPMSKLRFVGLDVHKDSIVIAIAEAGQAPAEVLKRIDWSEPRLLAELRRLGPVSELRVCYEAGPTGYGVQRFLAAAGVDCVVVAPSLVPQTQGTRIKTDRRDARKLAHFLRSGDLVCVWVPDEHTEALRDLERARDDARLAERRIKQQLLKFLLRNGRRFTEGKEHWTKTHWNWIRRQQFPQEAQRRVLADAIQTAEQAQARVARLTQDIADCVPGWVLADVVRNLQAFRGIQELTAAGIAAEIGDFRRFPRASQFMAFTGLVPWESSSGQTRRQGGITKTGNRHVRRLLIEAAWQYYHAPPVASGTLLKRRAGVPEEVVAIADRAQRRLRQKSLKLQARRKSATQIVTALARELAGFVWAAALASVPGGAAKNGEHRQRPARSRSRRPPTVIA